MGHGSLVSEYAQSWRQSTSLMELRQDAQPFRFTEKTLATQSQSSSIDSQSGCGSIFLRLQRYSFSRPKNARSKAQTEIWPSLCLFVLPDAGLRSQFLGSSQHRLPSK
jgi:hypothetical protein